MGDAPVELRPALGRGYYLAQQIDDDQAARRRTAPFGIYRADRADHVEVSASHFYHRADTDRVIGESVDLEGCGHLRARHRQDTSDSFFHTRSPLRCAAISRSRLCQSISSQLSKISISAISPCRKRRRRSIATVFITAKTPRPAARPTASPERLVTLASRRSPPRRSGTSSAPSSIGTSRSTSAANTLSALMPVGRVTARITSRARTRTRKAVPTGASRRGTVSLPKSPVSSVTL